MPLLEVANLTKHYPLTRQTGLFTHVVDQVRAVDGVDLTLESGETLGLVGESGCGKSTLGRCILRLIEPTGGRVVFAGEDVLGWPRETLRRNRTRMQIVFQDPFASLDPRQNIGAILAEPLLAHRIVPKGDVAGEVSRLLALVGLPADSTPRYPHEFSGGQRQRIGIARAIAPRPKMIVADEPVSALDVSIRARILELFQNIQRDMGVALIFIAHDLGAVRQVSDRVAVMYLGKIVETAEANALFDNPRHPYTRALLAAIPSIDGVKADTPKVEGDVPSPIDIPSGCRFRTRCPIAQAICSEQEPALAPFEGGVIGHASACHFAAALPAIQIRQL